MLNYLKSLNCHSISIRQIYQNLHYTFCRGFIDDKVVESKSMAMTIFGKDEEDVLQWIWEVDLLTNEVLENLWLCILWACEKPQVMPSY